MQPKVLRALAILPAALLVAIAGWQVVRIQTHDQSAWLGAGFSMFVYVDGAQYRPLVAISQDEAAVRIPIPRDLLDEAERLKAAPTHQRAARFAASLAGDNVIHSEMPELKMHPAPDAAPFLLPIDHVLVRAVILR